jgi:aminomethyltransferase
MVPAYHSIVISSDGYRRTPLQERHERLGASMTGFAGFWMPLRYSSETAEHNAVRRAAGLFDLSHMGEIVVRGPEAAAALDYALVGELSSAAPGRARYTMICAPDGGVLDDLVVYRRSELEYLVIANAANTARVFAELTERAAKYDCSVVDATDDYALIALQGPSALAILSPVAAGLDLAAMKYYTGAFGEVAGREAWVSRTGYTGEDGFEVYCAPADAGQVWDTLLSAGDPAGLVPAGLAARDTLRLEAGMPLYGNELGPDVTPFEANLGRVVKFGKPGDFVGRSALAERAATGPRRVLTGLTVQSRRVARHGYPVLADGAPAGVVTSGAPSPTLGVPIAMAYLTPGITGDAVDTVGDTAVDIAVDIRGEAVPAIVTELPFYRRRH